MWTAVSCRWSWRLATDDPITVSIETRTGAIGARVWKLAVGRSTLLLLDTNVDGNRQEDRELTARLYGGDDRVRIRQELLLGVGGVRALAALGISPSVVHLNEGHSAFAALELVRQRMHVEGIDAWEAIRRIAPHVVFTTHTPVPAGHDRFSRALIEEYLGPLADALGWNIDQLMGLGRTRPDDSRESFCMTVLALKLSRRANGVSALHGQVSRGMWADLYPGRGEEEIPIGHITNGVHVHTGSHHRCVRCTTGIWVRTGRHAAATARCGNPSRTSTAASSGKRTRRSSDS